MSTTKKSSLSGSHAATTPPFGPVIAEMSALMRENFGNPSSLHVFGINAKQALEQSRCQSSRFNQRRAGRNYFYERRYGSG